MASLAGQSWNVRARPLLLASRESASSKLVRRSCACDGVLMTMIG
jgi:hypothetical protein